MSPLVMGVTAHFIAAICKLDTYSLCQIALDVHKRNTCFVMKVPNEQQEELVDQSSWSSFCSSTSSSGIVHSGDFSSPTSSIRWLKGVESLLRSPAFMGVGVGVLDNGAQDEETMNSFTQGSTCPSR